MGMEYLHTAGAWLLSFVTVITIVIPPSKFSHGALELVTKPEHTLVGGKRRDSSVLRGEWACQVLALPYLSTVTLGTPLNPSELPCSHA